MSSFTVGTYLASMPALAGLGDLSSVPRDFVVVTYRVGGLSLINAMAGAPVRVRTSLTLPFRLPSPDPSALNTAVESAVSRIQTSVKPVMVAGVKLCYKNTQDVLVPLLDTLGLKASNVGELTSAVSRALVNDGPVLIECALDRVDCASELLEWGSRVAAANGRP